MTGFQHPPLLESQIAEQIVGYLEARGWSVTRHIPTKVRTQEGRWFTVGERGHADYTADYYISFGVAEILHIEVKRPSDRRKCVCLQNVRAGRSRWNCTVCDQKKWREREERRGARVWQVSTLDFFMAQYERDFGRLHRGESGRGQLELLAV